jgi:hypothetical protein
VFCGQREWGIPFGLLICLIAVFYALIFDETTDISQKEQFSLSIRHVLNNRINK